MTVQELKHQTVASALAAYVARDRRGAIHAQALRPRKAVGAALFADISGSTALAEALVAELGRRRGAEEVTRELNLIYEGLIQTLHEYGGSVIGFSGDAITCWIEADDGSLAIACAQAMQDAMRAFHDVETPAGTKVELAIKVAVTTGSARRFVVGDPQIQLFDVLAGSVLDELALAEHQAERGEIIVPFSMAEKFVDLLRIVDERVEADSGTRWAVITQERQPPAGDAVIDPWTDQLSEADLKPWVQSEIYARLKSGRGEFLAELRPAVALFFRFGGLQFDLQEDAPEQLDRYIRIIQEIIQSYGGTLIQLTMGDKGSYAYAAFGAPIAHEDDVDRAIAVALEIQEVSPQYVGPVQIGISQGLMRTGAYGSDKRRTYGVLGDEVNVAARLMQAANPGQVLVSESAVKLSHAKLDWQALPGVQAKGKQGVIRIFQPEQNLEAAAQPRHSRYELPMVGRREELSYLIQVLNLAMGRQGHVVGVTAPAGMGKTRLSFELIEKAYEKGFSVYSGECPSFGKQSSYLVWRSIWRSILGVDDAAGTAENLARLEAEIQAVNPGYLPRLPLLGTVLNLPIEENELTSGFDAKLRKSSLEALLISLLRAKAQSDPILLFLDDTQWIDTLSADLLKALSRAITDLPILILLTYRDEDPGVADELGLGELAHFDEIRLDEFKYEDTRALLDLKVGQLYGEGMHMPQEVVDKVAGKAQGNPFYVEELLNYLKDRNLDPRDSGALDDVALPSSLASLILSRIDQLEENQRITLRLASIIGRIFREKWLIGAFRDALPSRQIRRDLEVLNHVQLTQFETLEPEVTYLFKHIVTHEVAYDSLPFAMRSELHEKLGRFIERAYQNTLDQYLDFLAHHYGLSDNDGKKRKYLLLAGQSAQARYANKAAVDYYKNVLELLDGDEKIEVLGDLARIKEVMGEWDQAEEYYAQAIEMARALGSVAGQAHFRAELGEFFRKQGLYDDAIHSWDLATQAFSDVDDRAGIGQVLHYQGTLAAQQGDYETARQRYERSLEVRQELGDDENIANLLNNMGVVARMEGDYEEASDYQQRALAIRRELGDRRLIAISLNNLGNLSADLDDLPQAQIYLEESLLLQREVGDRWAIANCLNNLANVLIARGDLQNAAQMYLESLRTNQELGDLWGLAYLLEDIGRWVSLRSRAGMAIRLVSAAEAHRARIGAPRSEAEQQKLDQSMSAAFEALSDDELVRQVEKGKSLSLDEAIAEARSELEPAGSDASQFLETEGKLEGSGLV